MRELEDMVAASLRGLEKRVSFLDNRDQVQVRLGDKVVVSANGFRGGLDRDLQLVAQTVRVAVVVLRV